MRPLALLVATLSLSATAHPSSSHGSRSAHSHHLEKRKSDKRKTVWATPHDSYSSSVGVLGCKIDTNRVAYWPGSVSCDDICISLRYEDREVKLLRIDTSEGAYDVSYDAWNYLYTGKSATKEPTAGGPIEMTYKTLDPDECSDLIHTKHKKLPLSAANSMNFLASCIDKKGGSWVGENYVLYNIADAICTMGKDEECEIDYPAENQPKCRNTLGDQSVLKGKGVWNIMYPSGEKKRATSGIPGELTGGNPDGGDEEEEDAASEVRPRWVVVMAVGAVMACMM